MIMFIINIFFVIVFWNMATIAADEGRVGWAWAYLICSALNGAALCASIFQEKSMKEGIVAGIVFLLFFAMMFSAMIYSDTMRVQCREAAIEKNYTAVEIQAVCRW